MFPIQKIKGKKALSPGTAAADFKSKPSHTARSLAASLGRGAPAIQLAEHAQAILADDAALGITRNDPVLQRIANGSSHAVPNLEFQALEYVFGSVFFITALYD